MIGRSPAVAAAAYHRAMARPRRLSMRWRTAAAIGAFLLAVVATMPYFHLVLAGWTPDADEKSDMILGLVAAGALGALIPRRRARRSSRR